MQYRRSAIEIESPEQIGYDRIRYNLSESSFSDQYLDLSKLSLPPQLSLSYTNHAGNPELRQAIADTYQLQPDHVLISAGAAAALFIVHTALLSANDAIVVVSPNYTTNIETPRAIGCRVHTLRLDFQRQWSLDFDRLETLLRRDRIKLISLTTPHNPSGKMLSAAELYAISRLADQYGCYVLVDETYRDLRLPNAPDVPLAATLSDRFISVSSLSKAYGMPGLRIGWLLCQNTALNELFLAAKEHIFVCNSIINETLALQVWQQRALFLAQMMPQVNMRYAALCQWLHSVPDIKVVLPDGGAVCFVHIEKQNIDIDDFYRQLLDIYQTYVGRGAWFEMPDTYFRIGFAYPSITELEIGLANIKAVLELA